MDELLAYTKGGGGEFVASLQRNVTANPLPVALLGVSLAWLMAKPAATSSNRDRDWDTSINRNRGYDDGDYDEMDYPVATISGSSLTRVSQTGDDDERYTQWADDAGKTFRARTDSLGRRAGHFTDEAGNRFKGFADAAGGRIEQFRDEAGSLLDEASGWASHTWQAAREKMHDARDTVSSVAGAGRSQIRGAGHQLGSLNETLMSQFRDQPLVGGALAFALGAALGSALPHTAQEDAIIGDAADTIKDIAGEQAAELYEKGKEQVAEIHEAATAKGGELYQQVKEGFTQSGTAQSE